MKSICIEPNPSGAYPAIQIGCGGVLPKDKALWPDDLETETFLRYNGFILPIFEVVNNVYTVTEYTPNVEAWEAWKASLPDAPEPEPETGDVWAEMAAAITEGVNQV